MIVIKKTKISSTVLALMNHAHERVIVANAWHIIVQMERYRDVFFLRRLNARMIDQLRHLYGIKHNKTTLFTKLPCY